MFQNFIQSLLFRVVEIHRIGEATATPGEEGANLSERTSADICRSFHSNNKRLY